MKNGKLEEEAILKEEMDFFDLYGFVKRRRYNKKRQKVDKDEFKNYWEDDWDKEVDKNEPNTEFLKNLKKLINN